MKTFNVLLVDDEYLALNLLQTFVEKIPDLKLIAQVKSPVEASEILRTSQIDILFLDIQMPLLSGIDLLKTINPKPTTIFTTAYSEYALEAFDVDAVDYLLKPFSFDRFLQSVNKAKQQIVNKGQPSTSTLPFEEPAFLTYKADYKLVKILVDDILYIEGLREYVRIVTEKEKFVVLESLKKLEEMLPDNFLRVHKSYIVNTKTVKSLEGNQLHLAEHTIPISREKKSEVMKAVFDV